MGIVSGVRNRFISVGVVAATAVTLVGASTAMAHQRDGYLETMPPPGAAGTVMVGGPQTMPPGGPEFGVVTGPGPGGAAGGCFSQGVMPGGGYTVMQGSPCPAGGAIGAAAGGGPVTVWH